MENSNNVVNLVFADLVLLAMIQRQEDPTPPTRIELIREHYDFFTLHHIPESMGNAITNAYTFQLHIKRLRDLDLVTPKGKYILTDKGENLLDDLAHARGRWEKWPVTLPFRDGQGWFSEAYYLKELF